MTVLATLTAIHSMNPELAWTMLIGGAACAVLWRSQSQVRGTTLVGPWLWTLVSLVSLVITQMVSSFVGDQALWTSSLEFAAIATSFCPLMSLLGAKRPQDQAWHFIVLTLWIILVLPVAESWILRHGQMPDLRGARSWFMLVLILLGVANSLPTRFWFPALLSGVGQVAMLADYLPIVRELVENPPIAVGFTAYAMAVIFAARIARRRPSHAHPWDHLWLSFRDEFGLLWGLRVAERINAAAQISEWPLILRWDGFHDLTGQPWCATSITEEVQEGLRQTMTNLLRRFVSPEWIAQRLSETRD